MLELLSKIIWNWYVGLSCHDSMNVVLGAKCSIAVLSLQHQDALFSILGYILGPSMPWHCIFNAKVPCSLSWRLFHKKFFNPIALWCQYSNAKVLCSLFLINLKALWCSFNCLYTIIIAPRCQSFLSRVSTMFVLRCYLLYFYYFFLQKIEKKTTKTH